MKTIAIYGIGGFVGTAAAEYFLEQGYHVVGLIKDRNRKYRPEIHKRCSIIYGDVRDKEIHPYLLSKYEADYVLYLAAQPIVRICNNDPYTAYMTNVVGTLNFMEALRTLKKKPKKTVIISSDKAFGLAPPPYTEETPLVPADSYCTSKACQDMVAKSYAITYDLPVCIVRAGNLYGPDLNLSRLIPGSIMKLLRGESPMLYTGVANYLREFTYIEDLLRAFSTLLEKGVSGEAYNVGGTQPQRIGKVIEMIRDKINPETPIELVDRDFFELEEQWLCADKLKALGWTPQVDISEGLDRTISWFKEYKCVTL